MLAIGEDGDMKKNRRCTFCNTEPKRKINRQPLTRIVDGDIVVVKPVQMIDYAFYECKCGCRYTPKEMGEAKETWTLESDIELGVG